MGLEMGFCKIRGITFIEKPIMKIGLENMRKSMFQKRPTSFGELLIT